MPSDFRCRHRRHSGWAFTAFVLALTAGAPALAQDAFTFAAGTFTPIVGAQAFDAQGRRAGFSGATAINPANQLDEAEAFSNVSTAGGQLVMSTDVRSDIFIDPFQEPSNGVATATMTSISSLNGHLTVLGDPADHRTVTLHGSYHVDEISEIGQSLLGFEVSAHGNFSILSHEDFSIQGGGVDSGPLGTGVFGFSDYFNDGQGFTRNIFQPHSPIDFSLSFVVGETQAFDLTLTSVGSETFTDHDPNDTISSSIFIQDRLTIDPGAFLTDSDGNRITCGLSIITSDGFDFGGIPDCPGGGGGGGGGAGGVPEPAAWALMILGFGGVGAAARQRRHREIAKW